MNIFDRLVYKIKEAGIKRYTKAVCDHMLYIFNYFYLAKSEGRECLFIKEAVGMLDDWTQISENIYKHKPSGETIEIKKDAKIEQVTKKVMQIEIPKKVGTRSQLIQRLLTEMAVAQVDQYFKNNMIAGR